MSAAATCAQSPDKSWDSQSQMLFGREWFECREIMTPPIPVATHDSPVTSHQCEELRVVCGTRGIPDTVAPFRAWRGSRDCNLSLTHRSCRSFKRVCLRCEFFQRPQAHDRCNGADLFSCANRIDRV